MQMQAVCLLFGRRLNYLTPKSPTSAIQRPSQMPTTTFPPRLQAGGSSRFPVGQVLANPPERARLWPN